MCLLPPDTAAMSHRAASTVWACCDISSLMPLLRLSAGASLILLELPHEEGGRVGGFCCVAPPFGCSFLPPSVVCRLLLLSAIPCFAPLSRLVYPPASSCIFPRPASRQAPVFPPPVPVVAPGECFMKTWFWAGGPFFRVFQYLPLELPLHPSQFSIFLPPSIVCSLNDL